MFPASKPHQITYHVALDCCKKQHPNLLQADHNTTGPSPLNRKHSQGWAAQTEAVRRIFWVLEAPQTGHSTWLAVLGERRTWWSTSAGSETRALPCHPLLGKGTRRSCSSEIFLRTVGLKADTGKPQCHCFMRVLQKSHRPNPALMRPQKATQSSTQKTKAASLFYT